MKPEITYRCSRKCPIGKHCFIIKTTVPIKERIIILYKCPAEKKDIPIVIGGRDPPEKQNNYQLADKPQ